MKRSNRSVGWGVRKTHGTSEEELIRYAAGNVLLPSVEATMLRAMELSGNEK